MKDIFTPKLTAMFEAVEPDFRKATIAEYRSQADLQLAGWLELLKGPEPEQNVYYYIATQQPQYVLCKLPTHPFTWADKQAAAAKNQYVVNYTASDRDANAAVSYAKEHFISKQAKKFTNATKSHRGTPELTGKLQCSVLCTGELNVKYKNGDEFSVVLDMIVNYRYQTGFKSFYQFPARFYGVILGGEAVKERVSEKWMGDHFK